MKISQSRMQKALRIFWADDAAIDEEPGDRRGQLQSLLKFSNSVWIGLSKNPAHSSATQEWYMSGYTRRVGCSEDCESSVQAVNDLRCGLSDDLGLSFVVLIGLERDTAEVFGHIEEPLIAFVPLGGDFADENRPLVRKS